MTEPTDMEAELHHVNEAARKLGLIRQDDALVLDTEEAESRGLVLMGGRCSPEGGMIPTGHLPQFVIRHLPHTIAAGFDLYPALRSMKLAMHAALEYRALAEQYFDDIVFVLAKLDPSTSHLALVLMADGRDYLEALSAAQAVFTTVEKEEDQ